MKASWAGSSGLSQEHFQAAWDDPELIGTSISCYKTRMKCLQCYLVCRGSLAVAARGIMEGPKREVVLLGWRSNMELSRLFLSRNRLLRHDIQLGIKPSQDLLDGATWWGGPIFCGPKRIIVFRDNEWFLEKSIRSLNYWVRRLQMSKIH